MNLTEEQYNHIEQLASINYSLKKIALYLGVDEKSFTKEYSKQDSLVRYHYDRGILIAEAEIDKANLQRAKDGSLTAVQQWKKDARRQNYENLKLKILFDKEKSNYAQLQEFIETGNPGKLPPRIVEYYEQIEYIRCLYGKFQSRPYIINAVNLKWKNISRDKVIELINETIQFFNLDNQLKGKAWGQIYADKMDTLASLCIEMNDLETARKYLKDAAHFRGAGHEEVNQIPEELLNRQPVFYTMKIEDIGLKPVNRRELAKFIDDLSIAEPQKRRIRRDALIEGKPFDLSED